jgi:hypothetical protein
MKHFFLSSALVLAVVPAQAEVVTCAFTEPFITVSYDPSAQMVQLHDGFENTTINHKVVQVRNNPDQSTEVLWGEQEELTTLKFFADSKGGSDGMSETIFPMTGELHTGDTPALIGGCETPSNPAVDVTKSPVPGCYEVLQGEFEDGASYYTAIGKKIIAPLRAHASTKVLADFLSLALVGKGNMSVDFELCRTLDEVVKY